VIRDFFNTPKRTIKLKNSDSDFQILPETKVGALIERFPQLEKTLIEISPKFKQLRNPILRRTIARVASLSQVAAIGKTSLVDMINKLREEAGITEKFASDAEMETGLAEEPEWFSPSMIAVTLDARSMLEEGKQPVQRVLNECKNLKDGEIYELITPFLPAPLIEAAKKQEYLTWSRKDEEDVFKTYFTPKA
jgi:hypothetical protein